MADLFEPVPGSYAGKVRCKVCGRKGYDGGDALPYPWQETCLKGHPFKCEKCGRRFATKGGLGAHQKPRRRPMRTSV